MAASTPSSFTIYPAIDLRGGHVVRLRQGDFGRERVYGDDPAKVAVGFAQQGAEWIHIVDLDGALAGERRQASGIDAIVRRLGELALRGGVDQPPVRLQVAGGLRTPDAIDAVLAAGADRAVIGTAALRNPGLVGAAVARHGTERIAVALDVRDGLAVGDGWRAGAPGVPVGDALARLAAEGVSTFNVTAIERDGLLGGPDLALLETCARAADVTIVASGGIATIADLVAVRAVGCRGAIVGRALYDGAIDLAAALAAVSG